MSEKSNDIKFRMARMNLLDREINKKVYNNVKKIIIIIKILCFIIIKNYF